MRQSESVTARLRCALTPHLPADRVTELVASAAELERLIAAVGFDGSHESAPGREPLERALAGSDLWDRAPRAGHAYETAIAAYVLAQVGCSAPLLPALEAGLRERHPWASARHTNLWLDAVSCAGLVARAFQELESGRVESSAESPDDRSRELSAMMKSEARAALASVVQATALEDRLDRGDDRHAALWHLLTVGNSIVLRDAARIPQHESPRAETLAGLRTDLSTEGRLDQLIDISTAELDALADGALRAECGHLEASLEILARRLQRSLSGRSADQRHFGRHVEKLLRWHQVVGLLREAHAGGDGPEHGVAIALADLLFRWHLWASYEREADKSYFDRIERALTAVRM